MIFLCGLFFPVAMLPEFLRPLSYALPLTYGADILQGAFGVENSLPLLAGFFGSFGFLCLLICDQSQKSL